MSKVVLIVVMISMTYGAYIYIPVYRVLVDYSMSFPFLTDHMTS